MILSNTKPPPDLRHVEVDEQPTTHMPLPGGDLWVFAYGSLMWNPGFDFVEAINARVHGFHRALCVWSVYHRGTPTNPGLVFGLDSGGSCCGRAYRVHPHFRITTCEYLRKRELVTDVYRPALKTAHLKDKREVEVLTFVVKPDHPQYAGKLTTDEAANTVINASGKQGANSDYVINTRQQLTALGLQDRRLSAIAKLLSSP